MERNGKGGLILVQQSGDGVTIEVAGTVSEILANWVLVTSDVCEQLQISPFALAAMMPGMVMEVRSKLGGRVSVDLDAIRRAKEGHNGTGR